VAMEAAIRATVLAVAVVEAKVYFDYLPILVTLTSFSVKY
jgi:hypothetical protein